VLDLLIADRFGRPEPHYDDRKLLAEKARYFATDVVADWSDPKVAATMIAEGCGLFGQYPRDATDASTRSLAEQQISLRLKYGKSQRSPRSTDTSSTAKKTIANSFTPGERLPGKEFPNECEKNKNQTVSPPPEPATPQPPPPPAAA